MEVQEAAGVFKFTAIDGAGGFPLSSTREGKERMQKWNMDAHTVFKRFRFDERWTPAQAAAFALDFFNDPSVQAVLQVRTFGGRGWLRHNAAFLWLSAKQHPSAAGATLRVTSRGAQRLLSDL